MYEIFVILSIIMVLSGYGAFGGWLIYNDVKKCFYCIVTFGL